jgi:cytoskeletal protein RodZ
MSSAMKKLREDHSRDIKEIAAATRIKESYLKSIENEQYEKLPIEVYARGYIKVYAKYLGVPSEAALEPYEKYLEAKAGPKEKKTGNYLLNPPDTELNENETAAREAAVPHQKSFKTPKEPLLTESMAEDEVRAWYYKPRYIWKGLLLIFVLCVVVFQLITSGGARKEVPKHEVSVQSESKALPAQDNALKSEQPADIKKAELPVVPGNSQAQAVDAAKLPDNPPFVRKKHVLLFSATEKTWLQLLIDGKDKVEVMMEPGENLSYDANKSISGIVGNGGGVNIKFNGKSLPTGKRGEVIYLNLPENKPANKPSSPATPKDRPEKAI